MKIAASFINCYLEPKVAVEKMAEVLTSAGIEIEQVIRQPQLDRKIVVGKIKSVQPHPNADKLKLTKVDVGSRVLDIVCGAPNVFDGQTVAVATIGAVLPDGLAIEERELRGRKSEGMLASAQELGLSDDHSGIMVLPDDFEVGATLCDIWPNEAILDLSTHPNRPDLLSAEGLAQEIAAFTGSKLVWSQAPKVRLGKGEVDFAVSNPELCGCYEAVRLRVDVAAKSPDWLKSLIEASGMRPINAIVDVSNFVMLETGQPTHAFDAHKVKGRIEVRLAKRGEKLVTLDGVSRELDPADLVIADVSGPIALAGVMGGQLTEVDAGTREIILEAANFQGLAVRQSALRHGMRTEASARFERSLPLQFASQGLDRAVELYREIASAQVVAGPTRKLLAWPWVQHIGMRTDKVSKLLGMPVSGKDAARDLVKLGFEAEVFDIAAEARKHLGKPYVWGASFKTHGVEAFDCGYLVDYIYSLIGVWVGHNAFEQFESGKPVRVEDLRPGDVLFRDGPWVKLKKEERAGVSHDAIYVGDGKIIHAKDYARVDGAWRKLPETEQKVVLESLEAIIKDPQFLGARRYVEDLDQYVAVTVPYWRPDVKIEADLAEEIFRLRGNEALPTTLPEWQPSQVTFDAADRLESQLRQLLADLGLFEIYTYSFVGLDVLTKTSEDVFNLLKLANPLSVDQAYLRRSLLPSHLTTIQNNRTYGAVDLFEISKVFELNKKSEQPSEPIKLAMTTNRKTGSLARLKGLFEAVAARWRLELEFKPHDDSGYIKGRSAKIVLDGKTIGMIGQLSPVLLAEFKIQTEVSYLEVDLEALVKAGRQPLYEPEAGFQIAERDLAVVVSRAITWAEVVRVAEGVKEISRVRYLSEFQGGDIGLGQKSVAMRFRVGGDRALTQADIDAAVGQLVERMKTELGAEVR